MGNMIVDFIVQYWQLIVAAILMIVSFIIGLIKKRPTYNEADNIILRVLEAIPHFVNLAEGTKSDGSTKKLLVMESIKKFVQDEFSFTLPQSLVTFLDSYVEQVLSTPHKKEVID